MEQVKNEQTIYSAAVYCRLSKDDEQAGESVSIETQKMMLTDFCHERGFSIYEIYADDGSGQLSRMTYNNHALYFSYSAGKPTAVNYNGTDYYYVTNLQGDVVAILDTGGNRVVEYVYDAWGKILSVTGTHADTLGQHNPLRYRGYVYDNETTLYYLQSRYYDPKIGRFLNADAFASTGQGILGNNMFAYCGNNPVIYCDPSGTMYIPGSDHAGTFGQDIAEMMFGYKREIDSDDETLSIGISYMNMNGKGGSTSFGLTFDRQGNSGMFITVCVGGGFPSSGYSGFITTTDAPNIYKQRGYSGQVGASSTVTVLNVGAEQVFFSDTATNESYTGTTFSVGAKAALPIEIHGTYGYTWLWGFKEIWNRISYILEQ